MLGRRRLRKTIEKGGRELAQSFADYLSATHQDRLPRPGFYVPEGNTWRYLQGETEETQDQRAAEITDETVFSLGVLAEGSGAGEVEVTPQLLVLP
jgi:hypothetical protein